VHEAVHTSSVCLRGEIARTTPDAIVLCEQPEADESATHGMQQGKVSYVQPSNHCSTSTHQLAAKANSAVTFVVLMVSWQQGNGLR
jgi:hypothetical protein